MSHISDEMLTIYLDDALGTAETALIEQTLRTSKDLRDRLRSRLQLLDRGDHSLGAIWRRSHLTCPTREQLGSYLLQGGEPELLDYIDFHLKVIGCPYCQANLSDLDTLQSQSGPDIRQRRQRIFESSAGLLRHKRAAD